MLIWSPTRNFLSPFRSYLVRMMKLLVSVLACVCTASALSIEGRITIPTKLQLPANTDRGALFADTRVMVLRNGIEVTRTTVTSSGKFGARQIIEEGFYTVYFSHPFLRFDPVTVQVSAGAVSAFTYDPVRTGVAQPLAYPLAVVPLGVQSPYVLEEEFNAFQFLKNPMVIMGLVMVGLVWLIPKLQGSVSPEEMQEMRRGLEDETGLAAGLLKKMIPATADKGNGDGLNAPSLTTPAANVDMRKRK